MHGISVTYATQCVLLPGERKSAMSFAHTASETGHMSLIVIKHAQTAGNLRGWYLGRTDEPLCLQGREAAHMASVEVAAAGLAGAITRVYVSPLERARETARILFPEAEQVVVPGLTEIDFGDFDGKGYDDLAHDPAYQQWLASDREVAAPGGEAALTSRNAHPRRSSRCWTRPAQLASPARWWSLPAVPSWPASTSWPTSPEASTTGVPPTAAATLRKLTATMAAGPCATARPSPAWWTCSPSCCRKEGRKADPKRSDSFPACPRPPGSRR